ncbi:hypothetical protein J4H29_11610 [Vibrio alginolyticus]|uniref:hypothetical protein n=1 Tax=Vibrio alginolyticus TaxID=663 RepID=UPI001BD510F9|nr:hypothetical protein [Vibrio alginolyticus]MBT0025384.1 hypothetical protein [Vibrio alginolyticus]
MRPTILITIAILFLGCASGPNIAKKEDSNEALQIVTSAGAYGIFRDKTVPKAEVGDVGLAGYVGSTLMGLSLRSDIFMTRVILPTNCLLIRSKISLPILTAFIQVPVLRCHQQLF